MNRLWALKKELDPFRWSRLGPGAGKFFLSIFRRTFYQYPYCGWPFKVTRGSSNSLLGKGQRECWHCKLVFWEGSCEWPEMRGNDRGLLLFPITIIGWLGAFLVILGLIGRGSISIRETASFNYTWFCLIFVSPLVFWLACRAWQINRSIRRYNEREEKVS
jgi:hypothetical protein